MDDELKTFIATVEIDFGCAEEEIFRDRIMGIPFGDHDCGFRIVEIKEGNLPKGTDETLKKEYRELHGCWPIELPDDYDKWHDL